MATSTTTYLFDKPTIGGDGSLWGGFLNGNWDKVDDLLDGTTAIAPNLVNWAVGGVAITATGAEVNNVAGTTSPIQTQLDDTTAAVALKADQTAVALKADQTAVDLKADQTAVDLKAPSESPVFTGSITEETGTMPAGTTPAIDPANGTVQEWTLTANSSPTDSLLDGEFVELLIQDGTAYTITWPTITWLTDSATAPTLGLTTITPVLIQKVGTTLYGRRTGDGG